MAPGSKRFSSNAGTLARAHDDEKLIQQDVDCGNSIVLQPHNLGSWMTEPVMSGSRVRPNCAKRHRSSGQLVRQLVIRQPAINTLQAGRGMEE